MRESKDTIAGKLLRTVRLNHLFCNRVAIHKVSFYFCSIHLIIMRFKLLSPTQHAHGKADYIGVAGSILCLVHCLVTPALALGSSLSVNHSVLGGSLDYVFILVNGFAVFFATREHRLPFLRVFLWSAFALFSISLLLENHSAGFKLGSYVASGLLILGHLYNLIYCRTLYSAGIS